MRIQLWGFLLIAIAFLFLEDADALGQTPTGTASEFWPSLKASIELRPKTSLHLWVEKHNGEDDSNLQWKTGALLSYRMKRKTKNENRIIIEATPRYVPGAGFLLTDRNRIEFRWKNGSYNARYRNKLTIDRSLKVLNFNFKPYASGELFYDRNDHSWEENRYAFGVQLPYKKRLMVDTYYLRKNCTACSQDHLNVWGLTLNLYFRRKR